MVWPGGRLEPPRPPAMRVAISPLSGYLDDHHAPIVRAPPVSVVAGDRLALAESPRRDAVPRNALRNQVVLHRVRAAFRERLVVLHGSNAVRVSLDLDFRARMLLEDRHDLLERVAC